MCVDCARHRNNINRGNRDGNEGLGRMLTVAIRVGGHALDKVLTAMARGAENIGRLRGNKRTRVRK